MAKQDFSDMKSNGESPVDIAVLQSRTAESELQHLPGERTTEQAKAKHIMKDGVITVKGTMPIYQAIATLVSKHLSSLFVVGDNMGLVGVISEKDVLNLLYDKEFKGDIVEDFMTEDVVSFDQEDTLADICDCLIKNHFQRVAILSEGKLVSVISRSEIIEAHKDKFRQHDLPENMSQQNVFTAKEIMSYGLFTVKRQTPLCEAVEILLKRNVTGLPVVDDCMNLVGVITEKDILKILYGSDSTSQKVADLMTTEITIFNLNDSLFDICDSLINNPFRRIMILDQGKLAGIISRRDIIAFILRNKKDISKYRHKD